MKSRAEHIAYRLLETHPGGSLCDVALFEFDSTIYYSIHPKEHPHEPFSAVVNLIQGVYESYPESARKMLRCRLFTTASLTPMCKGMIKVAAKRATDEVVAQPSGPELLLSMVEVRSTKKPKSLDRSHQEPTLDDQGWMRLAYSLIQSAPEKIGPRFLRDRPVGAILVSPENKLLFASINDNASNKTCHAEVNLVQGFFRATGKPLPRNSRVYTTLKCCKMCAAMIWQGAVDPGAIQVFYGENDPGPFAQDTILSKEKIEVLISPL